MDQALSHNWIRSLLRNWPLPWRYWAVLPEGGTSSPPSFSCSTWSILSCPFSLWGRISWGNSAPVQVSLLSSIFWATIGVILEIKSSLVVFLVLWISSLQALKLWIIPIPIVKVPLGAPVENTQISWGFKIPLTYKWQGGVFLISDNNA